MKRMTAKFSGTCTGCAGRIQKGSPMLFVRKGESYCERCAANRDDDGEDSDPPEPTELDETLRHDRRAARRGLSITRFPGGGSTSRNARGRCEDAPCCGCCD